MEHMTETAFLEAVDDRMRATAATVAAALGASPEDVGLRAGKRVRPRLVHACAEALGIAPDTCVPWAVLIEMIHVASLVHDDVIDGALLRRGHASVAARDGNRSAVLAGDLLVSNAWLSASRDLPREATALLATAMIDMTTAELRERTLLWNPDATLESYFQVIDGKTAALFRAAAEGVAVLADTSSATRDALAEFGRSLGQAFQIQDDVRDYQVSARVSGKEPMKDLREGVVTLPLLIALRDGNSHARSVEHHLASRGRVPFDADSVVTLLTKTAAIERSLRLGQRRLQRGLRSLRGASPRERLRRAAMAALGWNARTPSPWALSA